MTTTNKRALLLLLGLSTLRRATASVSCVSNSECEAKLRPGSECIEGFCINPFYHGGCLANYLPDWKKIRVCNSDDPPFAVQEGACRPSSFADTYTEIRIMTQNWESAMFESWFLQIILGEILEVPVTLETGLPDAKLDFYHPESPFDYGTSYEWDAFRRAHEVNDCRKFNQKNDSNYTSCAHVLPEVWNGRHEATGKLEQEGVIEHPSGLGVIGSQNWYIPRFAAERDPTLLTYLGLLGEGNRRKLAETFLRPTTWKDYCDQVSGNQCQTDDGIAARAPLDDSENDRMFVEGLYTGHFRATYENNCDINPNCTGHIADYPCGWTSYVKQQAYHLNIAVKSSGSEPGAQGYSYSQLTEIWAAANATKSSILFLWWTPDALYQTYLGTDAEFTRIGLPPPTQDCVEGRILPEQRCDLDFVKSVGDPIGACDEAPHPLQKMVTTALYSISHDPSIPEPLWSPAYDTVKSFRLSDLQIGKIFDYWQQRGIDKWNFDPRDACCRWIVENLDFVQSFVPQTHPRKMEDDHTDNTKPLYFISLVMASFAVLYVLGAGVTTYRQRKRRVIQSAQIEFLWLLLSGLLLVSLGSLLLAVPPSDGTCGTVFWMINLGYTLELAPLIMKIAAIHRLMIAARRMRRVAVRRLSLFRAVAVIGAVVVSYLVAWTIVDPPRKRTEYQLSRTLGEDGTTSVIRTYYCQSDSQVWRYVSVAWQLLLLSCATALAFQTRKIREDLVETRTLGLMTYSHFVFVILQAMTLLIANSLRNSFQSMVFSADVIATITIYFVRKFLSNDTEENGLSRRSSSILTSFHPLPSQNSDSVIRITRESSGGVAGVDGRSVKFAVDEELEETASEEREETASEEKEVAPSEEQEETASEEKEGAPSEEGEETVSDRSREMHGDTFLELEEGTAGSDPSQEMAAATASPALNE